VLDPGITLRPSIETTFHATLNWAVVATNIPSQRLPMRLP
jgi:rhamnose utilization protein RhaD (predicted bifunctional aldolase and dehydrogenase)